MAASAGNGQRKGDAKNAEEGSKGKYETTRGKNEKQGGF